MEHTPDINQIALAAINGLSVEKVTQFIRDLIKEEAADDIANGNVTIEVITA